MSWNGLALVHYVGQSARQAYIMLGEPITSSIMLGKLTGMYGALPTCTMADVRMGSPGTLRNIMGRGLIIP
jgi:hypothetical protein